MKIPAIASKVKRSLYIFIATVLLVSGVAFSTATPALAGNQVANAVQNQAEQAVDQVVGAGTANQIKGRAKEDLGRVQRQVDKATSQVEGATKQFQGKVQKDIGRTQSAAENAAEQLEDTSEGLIDSIKNFFD